MRVFFPKDKTTKKLNSAIVFFHGGGWRGGSISQFEAHAKYYSNKGYVTFLVGYRVKFRNNTTPFESLMDAKSAMRYIKRNAERFRVDSSKIVACGGSAGGHLAAATALVSGFNEDTDDMTVSTKPEALVLFNPVIDNGPNGYGFERIGELYKSFSPIYNISKDAPPTIILIGSEDELVPIETIENYKHRMDSVGSFCEVKVYEGQKHGFFNNRSPDYYKKTLQDVDLFLDKIQKR
ncbi:alpha/beta hydrolase [Muricauda sp. CAU 1633]|nr:alpha/beta hydrolase [Muricauda sp. CAU 1633]